MMIDRTFDRNIRVALSWLVVTLVAVAGCDRQSSATSSEEPTASTESVASEESSEEESAPAPEPEPVSFEVDGDGVTYLTYGPDGERNAVQRLRDIPTAARRVIGIHLPDENATGGVDGHIPVAHLYGVDAGDRVEAEQLTFRVFERRARAGSSGGRRAVGVSRRAWDIARAATDGGASSRTSSVDGDRGERSGDGDEVVIENIGELRAEAAGADNFTGSQGDVGGNSDFRRTIIYGADWCPHCVKARKWMEKHDVSYRWRDIENSTRAERELERLCERDDLDEGSIPTIQIKGVGYEDDRFMQGWGPETYRQLAEN